MLIENSSIYRNPTVPAHERGGTQLIDDITGTGVPIAHASTAHQNLLDRVEVL